MEKPWGEYGMSMRGKRKGPSDPPKLADTKSGRLQKRRKQKRTAAEKAETKAEEKGAKWAVARRK